MAKKKKGRRKWVCLTTVQGGMDPTDVPTPYSDPFDYALRKKRGLKGRRNPRPIIYVIETRRGEFQGVEVDSVKELEFTIKEFKKRGEFQSITGPFNTRGLAEEAVKRYMKR